MVISLSTWRMIDWGGVFMEVWFVWSILMVTSWCSMLILVIIIWMVGVSMFLVGIGEGFGSVIIRCSIVLMFM